MTWVCLCSVFQVLVIGDLGVGKTSIIKRYVHQTYSTNYRATIGVDFALKVLNWDSETVRLQLWDIAGRIDCSLSSLLSNHASYLNFCYACMPLYQLNLSPSIRTHIYPNLFVNFVHTRKKLFIWLTAVGQHDILLGKNYCYSI